MATDIGPRIGVQGEAEFRQAIQNAADSIKSLDSEMKLLTASFDGNAESEEFLTKKNEILKKEIGEVERKIAEQEKALGKATDAYGENSSEALKWKTVLNNSKTELANLNKQLNSSEDELEEFEEAEKDAGKQTVSFDKSLKDMVGFAAIAKAAVEATKALADFGKQIVNAYADSEQLIGGVETLFGESASVVIRNAENAYKTAGLDANAYMETVTGTAASLVSSLGGDTAEAARLADQAIRDMSDNANKMGTDMQSIMNAYAGLAKGQATLLDNLKIGYGGTRTELARLLKDAEAISGVHFDIENYADVVKAINVIQTSMGITGTTAKEAEATISGSINTMQGAIQNLIAGLGSTDANITELTTNAATAFETVVKNIAPVIENIIKNLPNALKVFGETLKQMLPEMTRMLTELVISLAQAVTETLPDLIQTTVDMATTILVNVADALPDIISNLVDGISNALLVLMDEENLTKIVEALVKVAEKAIEGLIKKLPEIMKLVSKWVINFVPTIGEEIGKALVGGLLEKLTGSKNEVVQAGKGLSNELDRQFREQKFGKSANYITQPSASYTNSAANYNPTINVPQQNIVVEPNVHLHINGREFATATINDYESVAAQRGVRGGAV